MTDNWTKICLTGAGSFRFSMGFLRDVVESQVHAPRSSSSSTTSTPRPPGHHPHLPALDQEEQHGKRHQGHGHEQPRGGVSNVDYHIIVIAVGGQTSELSDIFTTCECFICPITRETPVAWQASCAPCGRSPTSWRCPKTSRSTPRLASRSIILTRWRS